MANLRLIKGRIKSVKNIAQITKAMELVAASKMKKAQLAAIAGKLYAQKIYEMVYRLAKRVTVATHPLISKPINPGAKKIVILISSNKGLCGGLNTNLFRFLLAQYREKEQLEFITLGKKGATFVTQMKKTLSADFSQSVPFINSVPALTELAIREYVNGTASGVDIVYSEFLSAIKQAPRKRVLLPLTIVEGAVPDKDEDTREFLIEPSVEEVFASLLPHYVENQVRDAILQADASEHSARMVAMRNATDNAKGFMAELTLIYNKARQEKITYEITDMITARMAVEG